jgi:hypothetical protein
LFCICLELKILTPDPTHRRNSNNNLNQSMLSQKSPPLTISGLKPYSSTKIPRFQNNLREIMKENRLSKNIKIDSFLFPNVKPPI